MAKSKRVRRMGRRQKNGQAPEDTVEVRTAQTGTVQKNMNLTPDRQMEHRNTMRGYDQKIKALQESRTKAVKVMKAEGYNVAAIKNLNKLGKLNPIEARDYHEQFSMGLESEGAPFRMNVFDAAFNDAAEQAAHEGRQHSINNTTPECRWPEGSVEHKGFWQSYNLAQAALVAGADKLTADERKAAVQEAERTVN